MMVMAEQQPPPPHEQEEIGAKESHPSDKKDSLIRARAYLLNGQNEWNDVATGLLQAPLREGGGGGGEEEEGNLTVTIVLCAEEDTSQVLFRAQLRPRQQEISRQQDTVISWTMQPEGMEAALSFETVEGCNAFWLLLRNETNEACPPDELLVELPPTLNLEQLAAMVGQAEERQALPITEGVTMENSEGGGRQPQTPLSPRQQRAMALQAVQQGYVSQLLAQFTAAEEKEEAAVIGQCILALRWLISLNHPPILRDLLSERHLLPLAGLLEYQAEGGVKLYAHRDYLLDESRHRQPISLQPATQSLIQQTVRLQFMKDVALPRLLDDDSHQSLLLMCRCLQAELMEALEADPNLAAVDWSSLDAEHALRFSRELIALAKASLLPRTPKLLEPPHLSPLLRLCSQEIGATGKGLQAALDLLTAFALHDPLALREAIIAEAKEGEAASSGNSRLLVAVIGCIHQPPTIGVRWQLVALLRHLLDAPNAGGGTTSLLMGSSGPLDAFLNLFYPDHALRLLSPLIDLDKQVRAWNRSHPGNNHGLPPMDEGQADLMFNLSELLGAFVIQHKYRIKYLLLRHLLLQNTCLLLRSPHAYLRLSALRLLRCLVGINDDFYHRFIIKQRLLPQVITLLLPMAQAHESASSAALLDLLHWLGQTRPRPLLRHLLDEIDPEQWTILGALHPAIQRDWNSIREDWSRPPTSQADLPAAAGREDPWGKVDVREEEYFATLDEEEEKGEDDDNSPVNNSAIEMTSANDQVSIAVGLDKREMPELPNQEVDWSEPAKRIKF